SILFANGAGLEEFLQPLIENAGAKARVVEVSTGIQLLDAPAGEIEPGEVHTGDPHTWVDPNNLLIWVENILKALTELDPANAADYQANAERYKSELKDLDAWVKEQVATIPSANRTLVTDHLVYGYFAERYGFEQIGAIIPGFSTISSPSAKDLASIEGAIQAHQVKAVFVSESTSPTLAQRVTEDTGVKLVRLYHGSLSAPDGPAATYLDMVRFNVSAMVAALK
ncbi:zinc ABC transporter substrate-binding protein, partial [bacterium]|nr:zinc ABC transporter substrate-binding protein [bacterium]